MSSTDQELLSQYARCQSDPAFTAVVERHVNLVYSAALRLTAGDSALAEDITQKVFSDLARKAASVSRAASVAGWLHTHTRFISLTAIRGEHRRRIREQEAFAMQEPPSTPEVNWSQLRPLLDEAVGELQPADRDAVILRFFENKSHREVGEALGLNENAARMKVERAVEKLQAHFSRRGITVSSAIIAATISANSVQAAPVGLGVKIAGTSLAQAAGVTGFLQAVRDIYFMSTTSKVVTTAVIVALIASIPICLQHRTITQLNEQLAQKSNGLAVIVGQRNPAAFFASSSDMQVTSPTLPPVSASSSPDTATPAKARSVPPQAMVKIQKQLVAENLHHLATSGLQYMLDRGVTQATYFDLVGTGTINYIRSINPVGNESYQDFLIDTNMTQVTQIAPDGSTVTYNL